jgi:hypothetical protein
MYFLLVKKQNHFMSKSLKRYSESEGEKNQVNGITQKSHSMGKTTGQIMRRHIRDKNDVITEEDFRNLNIDPDIFNEPAYQPLQPPGDTERPKDENKDPKVLIPWDIISQ